MRASLPDHFGCDACAIVQALDLLCHDTHTSATLLCVRCCGCPAHAMDADPGGRVVFDHRGWRGLHDSLWRTRRHS